MGLSKGKRLHMYAVYILRNPKNYLYVGSTSNVEERVLRHNSGDGAKFTKRNKDSHLVYQESFSTLVEARRREMQIKEWSREKKENLIKFGKPIV
jgi:predicted GIY-YIG superfamily endonuclease